MKKMLHILLVLQSLLVFLFSTCNSLDLFSPDLFIHPSFRSTISEFPPINGKKHLPCSTTVGARGVCMFSWACVTAGGMPIGVCNQEKTYGTCCITPSNISPLTKVTIAPDGVLTPVSYGGYQCGLQSFLFHRRGHIYNGENAEFGEFPWQVNLRRVTPFPITFPWCGGALLNHYWIITAAHCFHKASASVIVARLGELDFKTKSTHFPYVERPIERKIEHPLYSLEKHMSPHDVTLLKMVKPVRFQPHIAPICLPPTGRYSANYEGKEGVVIGWGLKESKKLSSTLQKVTIPILSHDKCISLYQREELDMQINKDLLMCAGFETGIKDACQGDSGGPLQVRNSDGRFVLVGIVSTGIGCAKPNMPGIYVKVEPIVPWILMNIN